MKSSKGTDRTSKGDGDKKPPTPSAAKLRQILGTSPTPRMLTPYEIELLRSAAQETAQVVREVLARERDESQSRGHGEKQTSSSQ